jgi:hypothetical protein
VLKLINDNSWFEGFDSFDAYVLETHGFASRKARYLIQIYDNLVSKQIPWDKVSGLGWTKLKDLAPILTSENVDEWVDKASKLTVLELQSVLKAAASGNPDSTANTTADVVRVVFKLKGDQAEALQGALAKAKGELNTEFDSVAIENIALAYLGDVIKAPSLEDFVKKQDFMALMNVISAAYPQYMITVEDAPSESQA